MNAQDVPAGYSGVHVGQALGIPMHFCIQHDVNDHTVDIVQSPRGISLKVQECQFRAIVEWVGHSGFASLFQPRVPYGQPQNWHVGFVQNLTGGAIVFNYHRQGVADVNAAIAPSTVPCKDSGSAGTWYDPSPFNLKQFGVDEQFGDEIPLPPRHPAKTNPRVRFIQMGDAPGSGPAPLNVPCASSTDPRAQVGTNYTISWIDPLNPDPLDPAIRRLGSIGGNLTFRTCLAMSSHATIGTIRTTTNFQYLYYIDWNVNYSMSVTNGVIASRGAGARVVEQGLWTAGMQNPIVAAPDANESVCVRFL